jgi:hypothetical protein
VAVQLSTLSPINHGLDIISQYGGFLKWGVPLNHPCLNMFIGSSNINQLFWGTSIYGNNINQPNYFDQPKLLPRPHGLQDMTWDALQNLLDLRPKKTHVTHVDLEPGLVGSMKDKVMLNPPKCPNEHRYHPATIWKVHSTYVYFMYMYCTCICMYVYVYIYRIGTSIIMCIYNYICITLYNWW